MNKGVKIGMRMLTGKVSTSLGGGGGLHNELEVGLCAKVVLAWAVYYVTD